MSKTKLYTKLKCSWREWDEDVYRLASSMVSGFRDVVDNVDAEPALVAEIKHLRGEIERYELWHAQVKKAV